MNVHKIITANYLCNSFNIRVYFVTQRELGGEHW